MEAAARPGCQPFGAVVVRDGAGWGGNRAAEPLDPIAHGETEAIRDACSRRGTLDLSGCTVFTSREPCAPCVATMQITGVERVVYAAGLADSARVLGEVAPERRRDPAARGGRPGRQRPHEGPPGAGGRGCLGAGCLGA